MSWVRYMNKLQYSENSKQKTIIQSSEMKRFLCYISDHKIMFMIGQTHVPLLESFTDSVYCKISSFADEMYLAIQKSKKSKYSYEYEIFKIIYSEWFQTQCTSSQSEKNIAHWTLLLGCFIECISKHVRLAMIVNLNRSNTEVKTLENNIDIISLVHRFGGWACMSCMKGFKKYKDNSEDAERLFNLLQNMNYEFEEAINDIDYKNNFFAKDIMRKNKGGLFLVRKQFFPFFENIMNRLICFFHENKLSNSNHDLNEFHRKLRLHDDENPAWIMFCNAWIDLNFFNVTNDELFFIGILFHKLVDKIFHANMHQKLKETNQSIITKNKVPLRTALLKIDFDAEAKKYI